MARHFAAVVAILACAASGRAAAIDDAYATTPDNVTAAMLELAKVGPEDYVIDLRSSDGRTDLSRATVVTLHLPPAANLQLRPALLALKPGTRIVARDGDMGAWKPDQTMKIENPRKTSLAHLWVVPARVAGLWCGIGAAHGSRLELKQEFQKARGTLEGAGGRRSFEGRIESALLTSPKDRGGSISMKLEGERLRVTRANGAFARWREAAFERPSGRECV